MKQSSRVALYAMASSVTFSLCLSESLGVTLDDSSISLGGMLVSLGVASGVVLMACKQEAVCSWLAIPLEKAGVDCYLALGEWNDMVEYAKTHLDLVTQDYKAVWWKLYNGGFASKWQNILAIVELLFCLPLSNGHLERLFSQLKLIKTNRRVCLSEDTLGALLRINNDGPPLAQWDAIGVMQLWWSSKNRRLDGTTASRKNRSSELCSSQSESGLLLEEWEEWIGEDKG